MEGDECRLHHFISWVAGGRVMRGPLISLIPTGGVIGLKHKERGHWKQERATKWRIETFRLFSLLPFWPLPQSIGASMKPSAKAARLAAEHCRLSHACGGLKHSYTLSFGRSLCFGGVVSSTCVLCFIALLRAEASVRKSLLSSQHAVSSERFLWFETLRIFL